MSEKIIIGKHTLESLTSGMYSDPFVVYREYIQNSVDSIDSAINEGLLTMPESEISIELFPAEQRVAIRDNGIGLPVSEAEKTLISIGNSKKSSSSSRGFRGIGRLAALSYCSELVFKTSFDGEPFGTEIRIDAIKLSKLLSANDDSDTSVVDVLRQVYYAKQYPEKASMHYFSVILNGVDSTSNLNNYDDVLEYLSQNIPVPFNPEKFALGKEIEGRLKKEDNAPKAYNVFLSFGSSKVQIFKPYKDRFIVDKGKNIEDSIKDIEIIHIKSSNGSLSAIGWIGVTNYLGSIYDKSIKGLRLRKGNILVGDHQTLNTIFKDARFNGWAIGEIYAIDQDLIPNARRDNFEKNSTYFSFIEQLTTIAAKITKDIRAASLSRNSNLEKALAQVSKAQEDTETAIDSGISSAKKGVLKQKLSNVQGVLSTSNTGDELDSYYQEIAFDELDMLIGKLQGATSYKALNAITRLTNTEKKILEKVLDVISVSNSPDAQKIIDSIIEAFASKQ